MFEKLRNQLALMIAPGVKLARVAPSLQARQYHAAKASRMTNGWAPSSSSADAELSSSLTALRNRSRALVRDAAYAKRAKVVIVNNVIGNGIPFQAQVRTNDGKLNVRINDDIETAWTQWSRASSCHTGGALHFCDLERNAFGQIFEAGEIFIRLHFSAFGDSRIPLALELIEPERLADDFRQPGPLAAKAVVKMGVEVDAFDRPLAYWLREHHPNSFGYYGAHNADRLERVPADQIIHLRLITRWPQTRGEPWMHCTMRKLNDMDGYSEAEIFAARANANYIGSIETPEADTAQVEEKEDGTQSFEMEPGEIRRLDPGEKLNFHAPNRPNAAMDPFMRMMLREVAAGVGVSYESISRDYSQSNYSSSRLALLEDRDLWRVFQGFWLRNFRQPLHAIWFRQAALGGVFRAVTLESWALNPEKYQAVMFKPRGWSWVDPTREVEAYIRAVRAGFMTVADVIALTGGGQDMEELITQRVQELEMMHEADLVFDTDPQVDAKGAKPAGPVDQPAAEDPASEDPADPEDDTETSTPQDPPARVFSFQR